MANRTRVLVVACLLLTAGAAVAASPSFVLAPPSPTLGAVPAGPGDYAMKVIGENASVYGPLVGGAITTTIEFENGGIGKCFVGTNAVCSSMAARDKCR